MVEPIYSDPNREAAVAARFSGQPYFGPPPVVFAQGSIGGGPPLPPPPPAPIQPGELQMTVSVAVLVKLAPR